MKRHLPLVFLAIACLAPWFGLGSHDLWNPDEADHAAAARELLVEGRWAVPTIAGDTYAEKPPLQLWGIIVSAKLRATDVDEFDARVPSAIGGMLMVAAAFLLGRRCGGPWHGALAALLTATMSETLLRARWCQVDALFSGFFAASAILTLDCLRRPRAAPAVCAGALLGLAVLTKGPLAIALWVAGLSVDWVFEGSLDKRWPRAVWKFLILTAALAVAIALPWYWVLATQDSEGFGRSVFHENVNRFLHSQDHRNPPWFYVGGALWSSLAPASALLPPAFAFCWHTAVGLRPCFALRLTTPPYFLAGLTPYAGNRAEMIHTRDARMVRFSMAIFLGGLVLLSIASSKQGKYLLPLTPFAAVIVADFARHVVKWGTAWQKLWLTAVLSVLALVLVIAALLGLATSWFGPRADAALASIIAGVGGPDEVIVPVSAVMWPLLVVGFGSFALLAAGSGSRGSLRLTWLTSSLCIALVLGAGPVFHALDAVKSPKEIVRRAMERLSELRAQGANPVYAVYFVDRTGDRIVNSWTGTAPFVYYATGSQRRPAILSGVEGLRAALKAGSPPIVLVMRQAYFERLPDELRARLHPRFQKDSGSRTLVLVDSAS